MNQTKLILMSIRELQFGMLQYRRAMFVTLFLLLWFNNQFYDDFNRMNIMNLPYISSKEDMSFLLNILSEAPGVDETGKEGAKL